MVSEIDAKNARLVEVTAANVAEEHVCCAIGNDRENRERAAQKKAWLMERFPKGHRFIKADVRGKVFIEFSPAEESVFPVDAPGYAMIQCFWVSGRYKGHGFGRKLYDACESACREAGYRGIAAVVGSSKRPFMVDKGVLLHFGFEVRDRAGPWYELAAKSLDSGAGHARFWETARRGRLAGSEGLHFFYSPCCPFNRDFTRMMADKGRELGFKATVTELADRKSLEALPIPWGIFSAYLDGELLTAEVMTIPRFQALLEKKKAEAAAAGR